jgi:hypothetical protein
MVNVYYLGRSEMVNKECRCWDTSSVNKDEDLSQYLSGLCLGRDVGASKVTYTTLALSTFIAEVISCNYTQ